MVTARFRGFRTHRILHDLPGMIVLVLIGAFQVMRGAWVDVAIFAVTLALVLVGRFERMPGASRGFPRPVLTVLVPASIAVGIALLLSPRHGVASGVILGGVGLVVLAITWPGTGRAEAIPGRPRPAMVAAIVAWTTTVVIVGGWEATAYLVERWGVVPDASMPAISELVDPLLDAFPGKAIFLLLWLAAGVALLRRGWTRRR